MLVKPLSFIASGDVIAWQAFSSALSFSYFVVIQKKQVFEIILYTIIDIF